MRNCPLARLTTVPCCAYLLQLQGSLLPALAKLAGDGDANIRDAAQGAMVVFAVRVGNAGVLDKVRWTGCVWRTQRGRCASCARVGEAGCARGLACILEERPADCAAPWGTALPPPHANQLSLNPPPEET